MHLLALIALLGGAMPLTGHLACVDTEAGRGGAVFVLDIAQGSMRQVGPGAQDGPPRWSPDGKWLAFESMTEVGGRGIYTVAHDGSAGRLLADSPAWCTEPAWSTDGTRVALCRAPERGGAASLVVLDLNTGVEEVWGGGRPGLMAPQWLPYTLLVRALDPDQRLEVPGVDMARFIAEARMTEQALYAGALPEAILAMQVSPDPAGKQALLKTEMVLVTRSEILPILSLVGPASARVGVLPWGAVANWSGAELAALPEGSPPRFGDFTFKKPGDTERFAFESNGAGDREIYVLGKRGIANVTNHRAADWNPVWSPDGKVLAFESFRNGARGVYTVYTDTAHVTPIAADPGASRWSPAWSPDGRYLAHVSDESGTAQIHVVERKGEARAALTTGGGAKASPAWRPELNP